MGIIDGHNIYAIMKTLCPLGYHHNESAATDALMHMMHMLLPMNQRVLNKLTKEPLW